MPDKQAFLDWIKSGKAFIGMHSATDTFRGHQPLDPYVEMIGGEAGPGHHEQLRPELECHHDADGGRAMIRELGENEPILGRALHPRADVGYQRTSCPDPVVEAP